MRPLSDTPLQILTIAPYEAMKEALLRAAESFPILKLTAYTGDLEEGVEIIRQLEVENFDAIISRGGTAELIRAVTDLPVIEIPVSVYDVLRTIKLSENYTDQCAIVGFSGVTENAHILCNLLRKPTPIHTVHDSQSAEKTLEHLSGQGIRTVICDMVTHRIARSKGMNALLITSGESSLHQALQETVEQGTTFRRMRNENRILRGIVSQDSRQCVVFDEEQEVALSCASNVPQELLAVMRRRIPSLKESRETLFYQQIGTVMHTVSASAIQMQGKDYYCFQDQPGQISSRPSRPGIHAYDQVECEYLFMSSFFSISGSMGELEQQLTPIADSRQAVMIVGETGTGKEQIARALYLRSAFRNHPMIVVNIAQLNDRGWDYLLDSHASPLNTRGNAILFQHLESAPADRCQALFSLIEETGLSRRLWLLFSCDAAEGAPLHPYYQELSLRLALITLHMPTLRSRRDEIPALASLYLGSLNVELNKQVSGFDPGALEMLIRYDWPGNYTQFKHVLRELAVLTGELYISNTDMADLLARERRQHRPAQEPSGGISLSGLTLEQITRQAVRRALDENNGNQTKAAAQLGISRSTLWRMLSQQDARS